MRYLLIVALLAQFRPPVAKTQSRASSLGAGTTAAPPSLLPFMFLAMLIWLSIAFFPSAALYRTQIPF
jgi:hypothetical protein